MLCFFFFNGLSANVKSKIKYYNSKSNAQRKINKMMMPMVYCHERKIKINLRVFLWIIIYFFFMRKIITRYKSIPHFFFLVFCWFLPDQKLLHLIFMTMYFMIVVPFEWLTSNQYYDNKNCFGCWIFGRNFPNKNQSKAIFPFFFLSFLF